MKNQNTLLGANPSLLRQLNTLQLSIDSILEENADFFGFLDSLSLPKEELFDFLTRLAICQKNGHSKEISKEYHPEKVAVSNSVTNEVVYFQLATAYSEEMPNYCCRKCMQTIPLSSIESHMEKYHFD